MLSLGELLAALLGTLRLARFQPDFRWFNATPEGFWRSFWAAALVIPLYAFSQWVEAVTAPAVASAPAAADPLRVFLLEGIAYVIGWVAYPLLMVSITRVIDRERQFYRYMVAYNWFQVPKEVLFFLLTLGYLLGLLPREAMQFLALIAVSLVLFYFWFIAKAGLEVDGYTAAGMVLVDLTLSLVISGIADRA